MLREKMAVNCFLMAVLSLAGAPVWGQRPPDPAQSTAGRETVDIAPVVPPQAEAEWTAEEVGRLRKQVAESDTIEAEAKSKLLDIYDKALAELKLLEQYRVQKAAYAKARQEAPADIEKIKRQLAEPVPDATLQVGADATVSDLEQKASATRTAYEEITKKAAAMENEPKRRVDRKAKIPEETTAAKEQLAGVKEKLAAFQADEKSPELLKAGKMLLEIQKKVLDVRVELLEEETRYYDATGELLTAQRDMAARMSAAAEKELKFWDEALKEARRLQADKIKTAAKEAAEQAKYAHPAVKTAADENARLAELQRKVIAQMEESSQLGSKIESQLLSLEADYKEVREDLKAAEEITNVMGLLLLTKRNDLPDLQESRERIKSREGKAVSAQLMWRDYDKRWSLLTDVEGTARAQIAATGLREDAQEYSGVYEETVKLLSEQRKIVRKISDDYLSWSEMLAQNDRKERRLVQVADEYVHFIDQNILWVRNSPALKPADFKVIPAALQWLTSPANWRNVGGTLSADIRAHVPLYGIFAALVFAMFYYRRRTFAAMRRLTERIEHKYTDSFRHTWKTLGLTLVLAAPGAVILLFVSWRIQVAAGDSDFGHGLAMGLYWSGLLLGLFALLRHICYPGGLGRQLGFGVDVLKALRGHLVWFFCLLIPITFLWEVFYHQETDTAWRDSFGRILFMAQQVALAVFLLIIFCPRGRVLHAYLERKKTGWLNQLRFVWYGAILLLPLPFLILAASGYFYAARHLHTKLVMTIALIAVAVFLNAMLRRWLAATRNRIAIIYRRLEQAASHARPDGARREQVADKSGGTPPEPAKETEEVVLGTISKQAAHLIGAINVLVMVVGIWWIWRSVLPALGVLEEIGIWSTTDAQGNPMQVTVGALGMAILFLIVTIVMARNLPGLIQVAILQRLPLDEGMRFAITAMCRYIIVVVGIILTFGELGVAWSKVQWLIAAMTVGLGFGLQEIFANFVSGLIILFEQPIRVGDMVTIGDINGKVTRIRIRATTVRKWDQKELIVPNKEFITGRVINWTLSDNTQRMDFKVGVAYGSDIKKTEKTLYRISHQHPLVVQGDLAPIVIFRAFGDSSLDFELRLFVPNMDNYLKVWHEINCAIDTEFRKEGIEIAFPQRDLHLRSADGWPIPARPSGQTPNLT